MSFSPEKLEDIIEQNAESGRYKGSRGMVTAGTGRTPYFLMPVSGIFVFGRLIYSFHIYGNTVVF